MAEARVALLADSMHPDRQLAGLVAALNALAKLRLNSEGEVDSAGMLQYYALAADIFLGLPHGLPPAAEDLRPEDDPKSVTVLIAASCAVMAAVAAEQAAAVTRMFPSLYVRVKDAGLALLDEPADESCTEAAMAVALYMSAMCLKGRCMPPKAEETYLAALKLTPEPESLGPTSFVQAAVVAAVTIGLLPGRGAPIREYSHAFVFLAVVVGGWALFRRQSPASTPPYSQGVALFCSKMSWVSFSPADLAIRPRPKVTLAPPALPVVDPQPTGAAGVEESKAGGEDAASGAGGSVSADDDWVHVSGASPPPEVGSEGDDAPGGPIPVTVPTDLLDTLEELKAKLDETGDAAAAAKVQADIDFARGLASGAVPPPAGK